MSKRNLPLHLSLIISAFLLITSCGVFAPSGGGNKAYNLGEYAKAADMYKKAYSKESNKYIKGEISFQMGECYRIINKPSKAATAYARALRTTYKNPLMELYLAQSLLKSGKPDDARKIFESYLETYPTDLLAQNGLKSCDLQIAPPKSVRFEVQKLKEINSKFSDYSAAYGGSEIEVVYFSSMRFSGKRKNLNRITGQGSSKIYALRKDAKGKWLKPEPLEEFAESTFDEGGICVSPDGKALYFTRCRFDNTKVIGAEIYTSKRTAGIWGEPELIPLAGDSLTSAHPAISPDNLTLYFVSDMPGGAGGKDIWTVKRESADGDWEAPVNPGWPINTKGDEMYPTVSDNGTLYFSSDGHPGLGGLDLFRLGKDDRDSLAVFNLGSPLNSAADDFGMVFKPEAKEGMFTSSRENVKGIDNIFSFTWRDIKLSMRGKIFDDKTKAPVNGAYLRLVGSEGTDKKLDILPDGSFAAELLPNTDYVFLVAAPGYFNRRQRFATPTSPNDDKEYVFDMPLSLKVSPIVLETIYYTPSGWEADAETKVRMDKLAQLMIDNPSVRIELTSHTGAEGNETDNIVLSQKRAQAIIDYLSQKGVPPQRLTAKSSAGQDPLMVTKSLASKHRFLKEGVILDTQFLGSLRTSDKAIAERLNHRTEFKVLE